mmetsp:Transcript_8705/g.15681  ORF Transcript_8705/g.15681 Transcript_8705/m.15681 type:complete len:390 (+) Transcript_8705:61-1230(+)
MTLFTEEALSASLMDESMQPSPTSLQWMATAAAAPSPACPTPSPRGAAANAAWLAGRHVVASPRRREGATISPIQSPRATVPAIQLPALASKAKGYYWEPAPLRGGFPGDRVPLFAPPTSWSARAPRKSRSLGPPATGLDFEDLEPSALSFHNRRSIFGQATPTQVSHRGESKSTADLRQEQQRGLFESIQGRKALAFLEEALSKERQRHAHVEEHLRRQAESWHSEQRELREELLAREARVTQKEAHIVEMAASLQEMRSTLKEKTRTLSQQVLDSMAVQKEEARQREARCQALEVELARREGELRNAESRMSDEAAALTKREAGSYQEQIAALHRHGAYTAFVVIVLLVALIFMQHTTCDTSFGPGGAATASSESSMMGYMPGFRAR